MKTETQEQVGDLLLWSDKSAQKLMQEIAEKHGVLADALADLVAWQREQQVKKTKFGMTAAFNEIFENSTYWKK